MTSVTPDNTQTPLIIDLNLSQHLLSRQGESRGVSAGDLVPHAHPSSMAPGSFESSGGPLSNPQ